MSALPRLHVWLIRYEVVHPGVLPPLPTTALHGALARALYDLSCVAPARAKCAGCPVEQACAYPALFEPPRGEAESLREFGVTTELPRPLVISPDDPFLPTSGRPVAVRKNQIVAFRMVATGHVWRYWGQLRKALERVGARGLGTRGSRVKLRLVEVEALTNEAPGENRTDVTLRFVTPLRIKHDGQIASEVDAQLLVRAAARRAQLLARLCGSLWQPSCDLEANAAATESVADLKVIHVGRYSSRQERWMVWPGLVGSVRLRGQSVGSLLPLLHFGSLAQIGKATTFGFGRYELLPGNVLSPSSRTQISPTTN